MAFRLFWKFNFILLINLRGFGKEFEECEISHEKRSSMKHSFNKTSGKRISHVKGEENFNVTENRFEAPRVWPTFREENSRQTFSCTLLRLLNQQKENFCVTHIESWLLHSERGKNHKNFLEVNLVHVFMHELWILKRASHIWEI
jgi:hypothetical protein